MPLILEFETSDFAINSTDDRPPLKVPHWTACADEVAHIEIGTGTMIAADQPDGMNTKAEVVPAVEGSIMKGIRKSASRSAAPDRVTCKIDLKRDLMRLPSTGLAVCILAGSLARGAQAQNENDFVKECLVTELQKMCECMSSKVPAARRGAAIASMRKSNAMVQPGGPMLESSILTEEEMQGLEEAVMAHASCLLGKGSGEK